MRFHRFGLELGMELAAQKPGMVGQFANFDIGAVGRFAGNAQPGLLQRSFVFAVEFVAVTVAFVDFRLAVGAARETALRQRQG